MKHSATPARAPQTAPLVVANARRSPSYGCALRLADGALGRPLGTPNSLSASECRAALRSVLAQEDVLRVRQAVMDVLKTIAAERVQGPRTV